VQAETCFGLYHKGRPLTLPRPGAKAWLDLQSYQHRIVALSSEFGRLRVATEMC
jgi:hypothetical protein